MTMIKRCFAAVAAALFLSPPLFAQQTTGGITGRIVAATPGCSTNNNRRVTLPSTGPPDPTLLQPLAFSGDFQRSEQRSGQIGFRVAF
jgi:hypothetical protein